MFRKLNEGEKEALRVFKTRLQKRAKKSQPPLVALNSGNGDRPLRIQYSHDGNLTFALLRHGNQLYIGWAKFNPTDLTRYIKRAKHKAKTQGQKIDKAILRAEAQQKLINTAAGENKALNRAFNAVPVNIFTDRAQKKPKAAKAKAAAASPIIQEPIEPIVLPVLQTSKLVVKDEKEETKLNIPTQLDPSGRYI